MADDVMCEFLVAILTRFDEASNKQALAAVDKQQDQITSQEKKGQATRGKNLSASLAAATKQVGEHSKAVLQFGEKIALGLAGIITSVEGAAVAGTFALARLSGEMKTAYYSGQKLGSAVKDMDAFRYASEQAGSSAAKAQAGLEELGHLRNTNPAAYVGLLQRLGVAATDAAGKLRSPAQAAMDLGPALAKLPRQMQLLFGNQLGMDDDQTLAMVRPEYLASLQQYKEMQSAIGFDPDKAAADGAKFQQIWTRMWSAVDIVSKKVQAAFFNQVGGSIDHITDQLVKNSGRITDIAIKVGDYVLHLATSIVDLIGNFDKLNSSTQRFIEIMAGVAAVLLTLQAGPIGIITALAAALAFLWDDYEKYKQGLPSIIDWDKWEPQIKAAIKGLTDLWSKFDDLSLKLTGQGGLQVAMEAFAAYMATSWVTKLVGAFATVSKAWAPLAALLAAAGYLANNTADPNGGGVSESWGDAAFRFADPGLADRVYGKVGEQQVHGPHHGLGVHAQPKDKRNLWQRTMPKALGGKDAPTDSGIGPGDGTSTTDNSGPNFTSGMRARNLGNIGYFGQKSPGLIGPSNSRDVDHSIALYATQEDGIRAAASLALRKYMSGMKSTSSLIAGPKGWTPGALGPGASVNIARAMGLSNQDDLHLDNPDMMRKFLHGLAVQEHGKAGTYYTPEMIDRALSGKSTPRPASPAPIGDQAVLDARQRIAAGKGRSGDAALVQRYIQQQNTPAPPASPAPIGDRNPDGSLTLANRTLGRYIHTTAPMFARGEIGHATNRHPGEDAPLDPAHQKLADAMKAVTQGALMPSVTRLNSPLGTSPAGLSRVADARPSTTVSPIVNQNVSIHGVHNPHDIEHHIKTHAKRGVQDAIRHIQGPSQ